jgi:hypothetical protein
MVNLGFVEIRERGFDRACSRLLEAVEVRHDQEPVTLVVKGHGRKRD